MFSYYRTALVPLLLFLVASAGWLISRHPCPTTWFMLLFRREELSAPRLPDSDDISCLHRLDTRAVICISAEGSSSTISIFLLCPVMIKCIKQGQVRGFALDLPQPILDDSFSTVSTSIAVTQGLFQNECEYLQIPQVPSLSENVLFIA